MRDTARVRQYLALAAITIVLVATYLALSRGLPGPFLIDDNIRIQSRQVPDLALSTLAREIDISGFSAFGRPVSLLSLYVTKYLYGDDPGAFKHENIALHLVTGLLIFWLTYRIVAERSITEGRGSSQNTQLFYATLTSAIWLAHPLSVSTVLYAVQRMTILSAIFTLAALLAYTLSRQAGLERLRAKFGMFAAVPIFSALAVMSKDNAALIPLYLLLLECLVFRFASSSRNETRVLSIALLLLAAVPLVAGAAYFLTHLDPLLHDYATRDFTLPERLATQAVIVWQYVYILLMPRLSSMTLYHDAVPLYAFSSPESIVAVIGWVLFASFALMLRKREPLVSLGMLFFLTSHLLESTIFPLELMFEHRNYLASFGLFLIVVHLLVRLAAHVESGRAMTLGVALVLVPLLLFQTSTRAASWQSEEHMLLVTLSDHPESDRAASALANLRLREGNVASARQILALAIEKPPHRARQGLKSHLLSTYCVDEEQPPEALYDSLMASVRNEPISAYTVSSLNLINQRKQAGQCDGVSSDALVWLLLGAGGNAMSRETYRFQAYFDAGTALTRERRFATAITAYESALEFAAAVPRTWSMETLIKLADLQIELRRFDEAQMTITRAQELVDAGVVEFPEITAALDRQRDAIEVRRTD